MTNPFRKKMVYLHEMNGSFSIKQVLPSLYPDDPELDYHNLDGTVRNGGETMNIYPSSRRCRPKSTRMPESRSSFTATSTP